MPFDFDGKFSDDRSDADRAWDDFFAEPGPPENVRKCAVVAAELQLKEDGMELTHELIETTIENVIRRCLCPDEGLADCLEMSLSDYAPLDGDDPPDDD